ncbi:MAG: hypothetical protein ABSB83_02865 [Methanomassiliicoccales archaeon]|jgi:hypothetical protein
MDLDSILSSAYSVARKERPDQLEVFAVRTRTLACTSTIPQ